MAEKKTEVVAPVMEKPKYPIPSVDTGQKVKVEAGYRYMVAPDGSVKRTPLPPKMNEKEKAAVKQYMTEKAKYKRARMQKSLDFAKRKGESAAKKANKGQMKEVRATLSKAKNAAKIEVKKQKIQAKIAALQKQIK